MAPDDDDTFNTDGLEDWVLIFLLVMGIACCYVAAWTAYQGWRMRDSGSEKLKELTNLDEITNELETWRNSHSMLFVLDRNLQMVVWSEGMIKVGSVWSYCRFPAHTRSATVECIPILMLPIHVCTHDPHDVLHRQVVLALEKQFFSC